MAAVVKLHDAVLALADNDPGLRVSITFPAAVVVGVEAGERNQRGATVDRVTARKGVRDFA